MKQIIILSNVTQPDGSMTINYAFWLSVPAAIKVAAPSFTSVVPGVTGPETAALQAGDVIEKVFTDQISAGMSIAKVGSYLTDRYAKAQAELNTVGTINKKYAGTYWDGTTWFNLPS